MDKKDETAAIYDAIIVAYRDRMAQTEAVVLEGVSANIMIWMLGEIVARYAAADRSTRKVYQELSEDEQVIVDAAEKRFTRWRLEG